VELYTTQRTNEYNIATQQWMPQGYRRNTWEKRTGTKNSRMYNVLQDTKRTVPLDTLVFHSNFVSKTNRF